MLNKINNINNTERKILNYYKKEPEITLKEIGKRLKLSQPAIGSKVKKLKENNIISRCIAIDYIECGLSIAFLYLEFNHNIDDIKHDNIINFFITTGKYNIVILLYGKDEKEIYYTSDFIIKKFKINNFKLNFIIKTENSKIPL